MADDKPKTGITLDDLVAELRKPTQSPGVTPKPQPAPAAPRPAPLQSPSPLPKPPTPSPSAPSVLQPLPKPPPLAPAAALPPKPLTPPPAQKPVIPPPPAVSFPPTAPVILPKSAPAAPPPGLPTAPKPVISPPAPAAKPPGPPAPPVPPPPAIPGGLDVKVPPKDIPPVSMRTMTMPGQAPLQPVPPLSPTAGTQPVAAPRGFRSSIRTMSDDAAKLKTGQQPKGIEVKPLPPAPAAPVPSVAPVSPPPTPVPPPPSLPKPPLGITPPAGPAGRPSGPLPVPPVPRVPGQPTAPISIPESGGFNKLYVAGIVVVLLVAGALAYYFLGGREPEPTLSPSPTVAATTPPAAQNLSSIFNAGQVDIEIPETTDSKISFGAFDAKTYLTPIEPGQVLEVNYSVGTKGGPELNMLDLLDKFGVVYPKELRSSIGGDHVELVFGQSTGTSVESTDVENRMVFILELKDAALASQALSKWQTIVSDLAPMFDYWTSLPDPAPSLIQGTYGETSLYFVQVTDRNTGLAVAIAGNYLIFASSKDSFELTVDRLTRQQ